MADFYAAVMGLLDELGVGTEIWPVPVEIPGAIPFPDDRVHASYDADAVHRFWLALVEMERVFKVFRHALRRQVEPRPHVLGRARPGLDPLLRPDGAAAPRRCSQLRTARDVGGVLARGEQLRVLARLAR